MIGCIAAGAVTGALVFWVLKIMIEKKAEQEGYMKGYDKCNEFWQLKKK